MLAAFMKLPLRSFTSRLIGSGFLLSFAAFAGSAPGDWPQWRGPNRDGISTETGLLKTWPKGGPRLVWKAFGIGRGFSTVSVVGGRIYTEGDNGDASAVVALNAADGKVAWIARLGKAGDPGGFQGPRATPTVAGDLVFAANQWGELVCLEAATGKERWRKNYTKEFDGQMPNWGYTESPLVDGEKVVVTPGGRKGAVVALNRQTGAVIWLCRELTDPAGYSSLVMAEIGGVRQYVVLTPASVAGVAAANGTLLWRASRRGDTAVIPTPVCRGDLVYVTSGYGAGCNLFKITGAQWKFSAQQVYANKIMGNHHGGVICVGDCVYGYSDSKGWTCQDLRSGLARWQEKEKLGKGSLVYADGYFYLREEDTGTVALIEASPVGYRERGRFEQPNRSGDEAWAHPVIAGGRLYLRDQDLLLCYDAKAP
jgi:outer membrane protein assembly factor BamB